MIRFELQKNGEEGQLGWVEYHMRSMTYDELIKKIYETRMQGRIQMGRL